MKVLEAMLEEDRTAVCGPRYEHQVDRDAIRAGTTASTVVLGARKVQICRPRVRAGKNEVPLPTFEAMAHTDPLNRRIVEQMLLGVATRRYVRSLEPLPPEIWSRGKSKSSVSRRFVARTTAQVTAWQTASLEALDLVVIFIDGVVFAEHCLVVALGIDVTGQKRPLGLGDGSTENATVCQGLLSHLQSRGLRTDRSVLVILDGSKVLRSAVNHTFGQAACVQRCQVHKPATFSSTCRIASGPGCMRSCVAPTATRIPRRHAACSTISRGGWRTNSPAPPRACGKGWTRY